jgi:alanine-glyoxylate transaminase/serine-glyoxylate transaminase/serine-pyruvate transaminase
MSRPTVGHLDPAFVAMMDETKDLLRYAFQTDYALAMPISAPGSGGMEACFVNLLEPGDKVVICQNGVFGGRMKENAERCGAVPVMIQDEWGKPVDPDKVEDALKANPDAKVLAVVQAETSTGALSDVRTIAAIARQYDCLTIVDSVTALGGSPLKVSKWQLDAVYAGTQKCLSCTPGLSPITFSERAIEVVRNRKKKVQSWFMDLNLILEYWDGGAQRAYHHTAPINALYGLHEALLMLQQEGIEHAWQRHNYHHNALRAGIEAMGLAFVVEESARLPQMNSVTIPDGVEDAVVRKRLLHEFSLEIGAGLGAMAGKIWRIGLMGYTSNQQNVLLCLGALDAVLSDMHAPIHSGVAVEAAMQVYAG